MRSFDALFAETSPRIDVDEDKARMILTEGLRVLDTHHDFKRGDLVQCKKGVRAFAPFPGNIAIFLKAENGEHGTDCAIGVVDDDGSGAMREARHVMRYLEPATLPTN